ncbi:hypothetical protein CMV_002525 [Castanea mollissima]|uniref:Uncharacterized protein n=1 Tax=Castanea mollissima TaxID=60419 RepID=A0A8J4VWX4_9ROSI|nr:hypothetical protein CMV_002525 [Castanea mollissima]
MSPGIGNSNKIRHIVRIRQMVQRWRKKARIAAARALAPPSPTDVPAGHVAVCVGTSCKRFIVRATHLNHPIFKRLLVQAEEEYGFSNQGPLTIPCDESFFEEVNLDRCFMGWLIPNQSAHELSVSYGGLTRRWQEGFGF